MKIVLTLLVLAGCGSAPPPVEEADEADSVPLRVSYGLASLNVLLSPSENDERAAALFDEATALAAAEQHSAAAAKFMEATDFMQIEPGQSEAETIEHNRRTTCANAALEWLNAEAEPEAEATAARVERFDPACAAAIREQLERLD